ncbi:MAG: FeoC-like transcriptional regulator [Dermatophilaceae bacterium]
MLALQAGASSRTALGEQTGLDHELIDSALAHLIRMGRLRAEALGGGCPSQGCVSCPASRSDGLPTCLTGQPTTAHSLVAIRLGSRPPD